MTDLADLRGLLRWAQDHSDELTGDHALRLSDAMLSASGGSLSLNLSKMTPFELEPLSTVLREIAEQHELVPSDTDPAAELDDLVRLSWEVRDKILRLVSECAAPADDEPEAEPGPLQEAIGVLSDAVLTLRIWHRKAER